jgi:O-acetyl-ADP-ribose deacetylase (regulator of RNase III)
MPILDKNGDMLKGPEDVMLHGCNCFCTMGAGIALQIRKTYPRAFAADFHTESGDSSKMGSYTKWTGPHFYIPGKAVTILNCYTQFSFKSYTNPKPFDIGAFRKVLEKVKKDYPEPTTIAMPEIGCNLGGSNWEEVSEVVEDVFKDREIVVYHFP